MRLLAAALALALCAQPGFALAPPCAPPADLAPAPALTPSPGEVVSGVPIAHYLLALSWTPQWCRTLGEKGTEQKVECDRPLGFTLHGLWPNGEAPPYPRFCRPVGGLDISMVRHMYCRTPSAELLQHEWQAHGACGWPDARAYFAQAVRLYDRVVIPRLEDMAPASQTAGAIRARFIAKNPSFKRQDIFVAIHSTGHLTEVRLCYDLKYQPGACPGGTGAPDGTRVVLAPSRTGAF
jgi:ribonuclease T2